MSQLEAVLLDIDGTLIDSNDAHAHSWEVVLKEAGHEVPFGRVRSMIGQGADKLLLSSAGIDANSRHGLALVQRRNELFLARYLPTLRAFPRTRELLSRMRRDGLRLVVATSAGGAELSSLLAVAGIEPLLFACTSSDDAERSKPDPDIVQAALDRAGAKPGSAVLLGDTPYDIEAARRAGVPTVALTCGGWQREALGGAAAIYANPGDLLARYDTSPFRRR
jgi:phosphoglycolate phosphatase-like HAD superfamily hydrolase